MRLRLAFTLLLACLAGGSSVAQTWQAYPAYRDVRAVAASGDAIWAATPAGIFAVSTADGAFERYTTVDGITGGQVRALAVDENGRVWAGYADGTLDRIDPASGEVRTFFDIQRADQYTSRGVNRIRPRGQTLLIGTDFGLVIWDLARDEVRQTASRLGSLDAATPVNDVIVAPAANASGDAYWLATDEGIVSAPLATSNLQIPSAWTIEDGFRNEAYSLVAYDGTVWAGGRPGGPFGDLYRRAASGEWQRQLFVDQTLSDLVVVDGTLAVLDQGSSRTFLVRPGAPLRTFNASPEAIRHQSLALGPDGRLWVGDAGVGLFQYPPLPSSDGTLVVSPDPRLPSGPFTNSIVSVDVGRNGRIWTASGTAAVGVSGAAAVNWFEDGMWTTLRTDETALPSTSFKRIVTRSEGGALAGTDGLGLAVISEDGDVTVFDRSNSTLLGATGAQNFLVISDMIREGDRWWIVNKSSPLPLHSFPGTADATRADWNGLPPPPGGPSGIGADAIELDNFGQKWLAMGPQGLMVWDTGSDPLSPADDRGRVFTTGFNGQGLPNGNVTSLVRDLEGRIWIGTRRGLAVIFSPGSAFGADNALAEPVWPTTGDGEGLDYLLRDADIKDLALDPAGRIWVSTTTGAFLLTPEGDGIQLRLGADGTPLPTDDIIDIEVDASTGLVYIVTANGLYSYKGDATGPDLDSEALRLSPNPYRPSEHARVTIAGINAPTSRVRVLTLDGRVVYESDSVFGGSFQWDGRDARTGDLVPSGVYIVAASGVNGEGTLYGKVAVLR
ncbi:hypothetical protein BSZ36_04290 [Rubricoccus marinus]|uniref:PorZ N-terminal beta-propeller domain-containing protein n=2 Tax=Rubricoccus marinus TaxID=716817 RepID=A0A259TX46_9BACT|nr:hypothetical protein BSZ36_04290 [Rubricoccus marinus]